MEHCDVVAIFLFPLPLLRHKLYKGVRRRHMIDFAKIPPVELASTPLAREHKRFDKSPAKNDKNMFFQKKHFKRLKRVKHIYIHFEITENLRGSSAPAR